MIRFGPRPRRRHPNCIRCFRSGAATSSAEDRNGLSSGFGTERDPERLVFFSDAVFAIAVTLLVLEIRPPQDTRHLLHGLAALWSSYLAYAITFLLIGQGCSTSSGTTRAMVTGCSAPPSIRWGREPSAGASGSPWPGSPPEPCWAPCSPSSAWS